MSGRRRILQSATFTLVLIAGASAQSPPDARAEDTCLAKPDATTPPGQHWYYRIDHANNKRQCWHLGPEAASDTAVQPTAPLHAQTSATASQSNASPGPRQDTAALTPPVAPVPWVDAPKIPQLTGFPQSAPQAPPVAPVRSASASDTVPANIGHATPEENRPTPPVNNGQPTHAIVAGSRAGDSQMAAGARPARPAITAWSTAEVDHTFAFLMVVFAVLAVTGPALHYAERRRRRDAINFRPPRWARVVALNAPTAPTLDTLPPEPLPRRRPTPVPAVPVDQTERLAQTLQQLVERFQTEQAPEPSTVRVRHRGLASG
jgi:hypothetical protein